MKISIVIPIFNVGKFLRETLSSIIHQTYIDIEIICVDDGSTDESISILSEYASQDSRVHLIRLNNSGAYIARQKGVQASTGDYILFVDGDDWIDLSTCMEIAAFAAKTHADIIQYGSIIESPHPESRESRDTDSWLNVKIDKIVGSDQMMKFCFEDKAIPWNLIGRAFKTSVVKKAVECQEPIRLTTMNDFAACFYIYLFSETWYRLDKKLYHYRYLVGTSTKHFLTVDDVVRSMQPFEVLQSMVRFVNSHQVSEKAQDIVNNTIIKHVTNNVFSYIDRLDDSASYSDWISSLMTEVSPEKMAYASIAVMMKEMLKSRTVEKKHLNDMISELESLHTEVTNLREESRRWNTDAVRYKTFIDKIISVKITYNIYRAYMKHIKKQPI